MSEPYHPLRTEAAKALVRAWLAMEPFSTEMLGDFLEEQGYIGMATVHVRGSRLATFRCDNNHHCRLACSVTRWVLGKDHPWNTGEALAQYDDLAMLEDFEKQCRHAMEE